MECPVCYREWDSEKVVPRNLPCGHSYCEEDLYKLFKVSTDGESAGTITCPTCCSEHQLRGINDIQRLIKNWAVIAYADTLHRQKQEDESGSSMLLKKDESKATYEVANKSSEIKDCSMIVMGNEVDDPSSSMVESVQRNTVDQFMDEEPPQLQHNQKCIEHPDELVLAFNKLTYQYLCSRCVQQQNLHKDYYQVYPSMTEAILERIEQSRRLIKFRRTQLEQTANHIKKISKKNRDELTKKFASHIEQLKAYFDDYIKRNSEMLNEALIFQETRTDDVIDEINEALEKLDSDSNSLSSLGYHEENVIVFMNGIVNDLYEGLVKFSPDINIEGLQIEVEIDDDVIPRIDKILSRSAELMHSALPALDGSDRLADTYKDLIKNMWNCLSCGAQFGIRQVECHLCKTFRPLETLDNLLHRPEKVTTDEIDALKLRRKIEKQIILDLELNGEDLNRAKKDRKREVNKTKDYWFMISSDWLFKWKCFVTNKISKAVNQDILHEINQSLNSRIGILPPGPITNYTLFEQDGIVMDTTMFGTSANTHKPKAQKAQPEIREDLVVELDYKTVKKEVWSKFIKIYGGGPSIVREKPYIYSAAVEDNPVPAAARMQSPSQALKQRDAQKQKKDKNAAAEEPVFPKQKSSVQKSLSKQALEKLPSQKQPVAQSQQPASSEASEHPKNIFAKKLVKQQTQKQQQQQLQQQMAREGRKEGPLYRKSDDVRANGYESSLRQIQTEINEDLREPSAPRQIASRAKNFEDEESKTSENVEDDAIEEKGTKSANIGKASQVVAPRMMSLAITGKSSLMHQSFPDLLSPKSLRESAAEPKEPEELKRGGGQRRRGERPGSRPSRQLDRPPKKMNRVSDGIASENDSDDEINVNVAFQQHVLKKNMSNIEDSQKYQQRQRRQVKKKSSSDLEEPRTPTNGAQFASASGEKGESDHISSSKFGEEGYSSSAVQQQVRSDSKEKDPQGGFLGNLLSGANQKKRTKTVAKKGGAFNFF